MGAKSHKLIIFPCVVTSLTVIAGFILSSSATSADDSIIDQINITVPVSCTMTGTGMNSHTATLQNNSYTPDIGTTTLHAFCNDTNGFAIYAAGYTGDQIGGTNSTKLVGSPSTIGNIDTGTATSGNTSNWAMKLAIYQDSGDTSGTNAVAIDNGFDNYHTVPSSYTKVAHKDVSTDMTASTGGVKLTTTYAAFISPTQPAGTYTGKVIYTLVHPASEIPLQPEVTEAGCIRYYPNGGNVEGTMGCQTVSTSATSTILLASNFSRTGYGFAGWNTEYDYSGTDYGPQENITFTAGQYTGNNPGLSLYAHWIKSAGTIQNWTGCSSLASGAVTALTDQRDGETYAVAKLADGNCWMIENMRLQNTNSDNATGTLAQGYGGQFSGLADSEALSLFTDVTTANTLYSTDGANGTINIGTSNASSRFPRYNNKNTPTSVSDRPQNPTTNSATNSTSSASLYSYGNYYTWAAAVADTTNYATNNQSVTSTSICPSGWHLPKGGNKSNEANNELWALIVNGVMEGTKPANYSSQTQPYYSGTTEARPVTNALRAYPNNFVNSGIATSGSVADLGGAGHYWSSTSYSASRSAYRLNIFTSKVYPGTEYTSRYSGLSVRCLISGT